jgi:hypothetical protein
MIHARPLLACIALACIALLACGACQRPARYAVGDCLRPKGADVADRIFRVSRVSGDAYALYGPVRVSGGKLAGWSHGTTARAVVEDEYQQVDCAEIGPGLSWERPARQDRMRAYLERKAGGARPPNAPEAKD